MGISVRNKPNGGRTRLFLGVISAVAFLALVLAGCGGKSNPSGNTDSGISGPDTSGVSPDTGSDIANAAGGAWVLQSCKDKNDCSGYIFQQDSEYIRIEKLNGTWYQVETGTWSVSGDTLKLSYSNDNGYGYSFTPVPNVSGSTMKWNGTYVKTSGLSFGDISELSAPLINAPNEAWISCEVNTLQEECVGHIFLPDGEYIKLEKADDSWCPVATGTWSTDGRDLSYSGCAFINGSVSCSSGNSDYTVNASGNTLTAWWDTVFTKTPGLSIGGDNCMENSSGY
jgi:hypothetical protein